MAPMAWNRFVEVASSLVERGEWGAVRRGALVVDLDEAEPPGDATLPGSADTLTNPLLAGLPAVVIGVAPDACAVEGVDLVDVVVGDEAAATEVVAAVDAHPIAATSLAILLRGAATRTAGEGLVAESATYSLLQAGPEHAAWLRRRGAPRVRPDDDRPRVRLARDGDVLRVTLDRPAVRNAYDARMRDELLEALAVAQADPALRVVIDGAGPAFCSGGDLDEFGTRPDPATAHLIRLGRSAARALAELADRVTVRVHGASVGSAVELAAFAGRVVAAPDSTFALPEVAMGLVPGAGGTVSIPARIGRHRTAWLALTGGSIDAATARRWGLVDEIET